MSSRRLGKRVPSATYVGNYSLSGYILKFHKVGKDGSAKCDAFHTGKDTDVVYGVVYTIDMGEKKILDEVEGLGNGYEEKRVDLYCKGMANDSAYLYYATNINDAILPFSWYVHHVLYGAREAHLPESYVKKIADVISVKDPDAERELLERSVYALEELALPAFDQEVG